MCVERKRSTFQVCLFVEGFFLNSDDNTGHGLVVIIVTMIFMLLSGLLCQLHENHGNGLCLYTYFASKELKVRSAA